MITLFYVSLSPNYLLFRERMEVRMEIKTVLPRSIVQSTQLKMQSLKGAYIQIALTERKNRVGTYYRLA